MLATSRIPSDSAIFGFVRSCSQESSSRSVLWAPSRHLLVEQRHRSDFSTFRDIRPLSFQYPPQVGDSLVVILKRSFASPVLSELGFKINDNFKKQCVWLPRWTSCFLGKIKDTMSGPWKTHALTSFCLEQTFSHFPFTVATLSGSVGNNCEVLRNALNGESLIFHYHLDYQLL